MRHFKHIRNEDLGYFISFSEKEFLETCPNYTKEQYYEAKMLLNEDLASYETSYDDNLTFKKLMIY